MSEEEPGDKELKKGKKSNLGLDFVNLDEEKEKRMENPEFDIFKMGDAEAQGQPIEIKRPPTEKEIWQKEKLDLQASLQSARESSASMESKVQELDSTIAAKDNQIQQLTSEADARIKELEDQVADLKSQVDGFESEKQGLLGEKDDLKNQLSSENDALRSELQAKIDDLTSTISNLEADKTRLESQLTDATEQIAKKDELLQAAEEEKKSLQSSIADLEKKLSEKDSGFYGTGPGPEVAARGAGEQRIVCPKCGNINIKVESDRSRILSYIGGVPYYAKKYSCKKCMYEFRIE